MTKWNEFYKKSLEIERPSLILKKFFVMNLDIKKVDKRAIDLGCGSGNDAIFLLNHRISGYCN